MSDEAHFALNFLTLSVSFGICICTPVVLMLPGDSCIVRQAAVESGIWLQVSVFIKLAVL